MVLDCMITVMILNLVLIRNKWIFQFILINLLDRQLQIKKKIIFFIIYYNFSL